MTDTPAQRAIAEMVSAVRVIEGDAAHEGKRVMGVSLTVRFDDGTLLKATVGNLVKRRPQEV